MIYCFSEIKQKIGRLAITMYIIYVLIMKMYVFMWRETYLSSCINRFPKDNLHPHPDERLGKCSSITIIYLYHKSC